ncbi:MAG: ferrous iron transport protein B [Candidatus Goldiibacteriota bacterium]
MSKKIKTIRVALAGNPNSGKTSLFNALVGSHMKVGNWPGVTVEKHQGRVKHKGYKIEVVDLPGSYSLSAYSPEELIARDYIIEEKPDVVVNVIDSTNLERSLFFTTQLMELETNILIALNMSDELEKKDVSIDDKGLQKLLGCHIVPIAAVKKRNINKLLDHIARVFEKDIEVKKDKFFYDDEMEEKIKGLVKIINKDRELCGRYRPRWLAVKLLENDQPVYEKLKDRAVWLELQPAAANAVSELEKEEESSITARMSEDRYAFIRGAVAETVIGQVHEHKTVTDRIDSVLINRFLGIPIFLGIMWIIFQATFTLGAAPMAWIEMFFEWLGGSAGSAMPDNQLRSVVVDGIIAGVGGVVVFLPNILLLFLGLAVLEGTGYMARAAYVVDKVFHKFGLHGKSFIPMVTGFGCSVPAFMACRTLKNRGDRLATMMVIPFMSCGAKLPVYILVIGAFFPENIAGNILFGVYLFGIIMAVLSARLFKSTVFKGESETFVMELPVYRLPGIGSVLMQMWMKAWMYLKKAGTIILAASIIIWAATSYPKNQAAADEFEAKSAGIAADTELSDDAKREKLTLLENEMVSSELENSFAGSIGKVIEPVIRPLGFDWKIGIALITGLAAKEVVVSTLGTIYALGDTDEESKSLRDRLRANPDYGIPMALALLVFTLMYVPCAAATVVFHKEAGSIKWTWFYIGYAMLSAYLVSFIVYRAALFFV